MRSRPIPKKPRAHEGGTVAMLDQVVSPTRPAKPIFPDAATLPEMFMKRAERSADALAFKVKEGGNWQEMTWQAFYDQAASLATWFMDHGLVAGDKITVVGSTRPEWCVSDFGG
ncbi:MAG TPA: AMP-binding protein, partial [Polyangiaceae bacterium]|nr:AMP-binding protein [Polyangiaceae bacterium]